MKSIGHSASGLAVAIALLASSAQAQSTTSTWNVLGGGSQQWQVAGNWTPAGFPNSNTSIANLSVGLTAGLTVNVGATDVTASSILMGGIGAPVATTIAGGGVGRLILENSDAGTNNNTGNVWLTSGGAAGSANSISAPILVNNDVVEIDAASTNDIALTGVFSYNGTGVNLRNLSTKKLTVGNINLVDTVTTLSTGMGFNTSPASTGTIEISGVMSNSGNTGAVTNTMITYGSTSGNAALSTVILSGANTHTMRTIQNRVNLVLASNLALGTDATLDNTGSGASYRNGNPAQGFGFNLLSTDDARTISVDVDYSQWMTLKGDHSLEWAGSIVGGASRGFINLLPAGKQFTVSGKWYGVRPADSTFTRTQVVDGTGKTVITGGYRNSGGAATEPLGNEIGELRKTGVGVLVITGGNSTYTGRTLVDGGNLHFAADADFASTSANAQVFSPNLPGPIVANGGAVGVDTGVSANSGFLLKLHPDSTGGLMLAPSDASAALNFTAGDLNTNASKMSVAAPETGLTYTGTITPATADYRLGGGSGTLTLPNANQLTGARNLVATNGGTVALTNTNSYTGTTSALAKYMQSNTNRAIADMNTGSDQILVGTTIAAATLANGGAASSIGTSSNAAANLWLHGSTLKYTGAGASTDRLFTVGTAGATLDASGTGAVTFANAGAVAYDEAQTRDGGFDAFNNDNTNILTVPDTSDLVVGMTVTAASGFAAVAFPANATVAAILTPTKVRLSAGVASNAIDTGTVSFGAVARTLTLAGSNTGANTLASVVGNATANVGVTKSGTGKWVLSGANTYLGPTAVQGGTLQMTGSETGSSAATVASGGTLEVRGTMGVTGNATFSAGSTLAIDIAGTGAGQFGKLALTGTGILAAGGTFAVNLQSFSPVAGNSFDVLDFVSATGAFALSLPSLSPGLAWNTSSLLTTGVLSVTGGAASNADFDGSGIVDGNDFLRWQRGFGITSGATLGQGDADGNGAVDAADLTIWKSKFGGPPAVAAAAGVPEPSSFMLAAVVSMAIVRQGRRARSRRNTP